MTRRTPAKPPSRQAIGLPTLARCPGTQRRRPVLIVCEGEQTEQIYFNALRQYYRLSTVDIEIHGEGAGSLRVVQRAIRLIEERNRAARRARDAPAPYEEAWCVFDREAFNEPSGFPGAVQLAREHRVHLAISNPSFEYWYLLHFVETSRPFHDGNEVTRELKDTCIPDYHKSLNVFDRLHKKTHEARDRAERFYELHPDREQDPYPNPSTLVFRLVGGIVAMTPY